MSHFNYYFLAVVTIAIYKEFSTNAEVWLKTLSSKLKFKMSRSGNDECSIRVVDCSIRAFR